MVGLLRLCCLALALALAAMPSLPAKAQGVDGVGRLETPNGAAFCSGALVAADVVLTAAHCVAKWADQLSAVPDAISFRPGRLRASPSVAVERIVLHPLYHRSLNTAQKLRFDLALVKLVEEVPADISAALLQGKEATEGERLFIVSWRGSDGGTPQQKSCDVRHGMPGLVTLECEVKMGESGSPVLRQGENGLEVVAVISSLSRLHDRPTAQASDVALRLPALMQELARALKSDGS